jgi:hypothetical protein
MKVLLAAVLAVSLASEAGAAVKLGYGTIPGSNSFTVYNYTTDKQVNDSEDFSLGVFTVGADAMQKVTDLISIGAEVTAGAPMGSYEFDETKTAVGIPAGFGNPNADSTATITAATLGAMAKVQAGLTLGPGTGTLGLGLGSIMIAAMYEGIEQNWTGATGTTKAGKNTDRGTMLVPVFVIQVTPGYKMVVGNDVELGLEIPLSLMSETDLTREQLDEPTDPDVENPAIDGMKMGGFGFGVNLVISKKI